MPITLPTRRLVSQADASHIENAHIPRSRFTGSWTHKTSFDAGYLVPFLVDEILPGDHMRYNVTAYVRMSTPLFPLFDNQRIDTHFFFVPNRLSWTNWKKFMGEQVLPSSSINYTVPQYPSANGGDVVGSLADYFGIPVIGQVTPGESINVNAMPFRAYQRIWNDWFRDENIQDSIILQTGDGPDTQGGYSPGVLRRAKSHDYFTSALPWPQKFTAPTVPLGGLAPIIGIGASTQNYGVGPVSVYQNQGATQYNYYKVFNAAGADNEMVVAGSAATGGVPNIYADLSEATGVAINTFRQAFLVQTLLERDARGGTRYTEIVRSHFGVTSPDARMQRPEYIGGGQTPLQITPIAQTAPSDETTVGALGAAGTATGSHSASYAAVEHGFVIGLISVKTELSYQQGIPRQFLRTTRYDYYWPALATLGEQAILRREIYATNADDPDMTIVFGYQEAWHEYRTNYSIVTSVMRSTATPDGTLDAWHLAQEFSSAPVLNDAFIVDNPPMTRVLAAGALAVRQQYLADILIHRDAVRPIPMFGTPATLGRF